MTTAQQNLLLATETVTVISQKKPINKILKLHILCVMWQIHLICFLNILLCYVIEFVQYSYETFSCLMWEINPIWLLNILLYYVSKSYKIPVKSSPVYKLDFSNMPMKECVCGQNIEILNVKPAGTYSNQQSCKGLGRWGVLTVHSVSIISELWNMQGRH